MHDRSRSAEGRKVAVAPPSPECNRPLTVCGPTPSRIEGGEDADQPLLHGLTERLRRPFMATKGQRHPCLDYLLPYNLCRPVPLKQ